MSRRQLLFLTLALVLTPILPAQTGLISTVAGTGVAGTAGVGGPASNAQLYQPGGICIDSADNLYIADTGNSRVVRVDAASGTLTLVAGNGTPGFSGDTGPAQQASLNAPVSVVLDGGGNLLIADRGNHRIRRVDAVTGIITTVAGNGSQGFSGDGGPAGAAQLNGPWGLTLDAGGSLYIADTFNNRIRRVDAQTGIISTVIGNGSSVSSPDGSAVSSAAIGMPIAVSVDRSGNLLIGEFASSNIRKVDLSTGLLSTYAGNGGKTFNGDGQTATSAAIGDLAGNVAFDSAGNAYFSDLTGRIRRVDPTGQILTVAGNGTGMHNQLSSGGGGGGPVCVNGPIGDNGPASNSTIDGAIGVAITRNGNLLLSDWIDCRVRRVALPSPSPYTGTVLTANPTNAQLGQTVTFTATVSPIGSAGTPTGSVQFLDQPLGFGGTVLGVATLSGGSATLYVNNLPANGGHLVYALYSGDASFNGSGSAPVSVNVTTASKPTAAVTLASGQNPASVNATVQFTITVAGSSTQPTGTVQLYVGSSVVGSATLSNGQAQIPLTFPGPGSFTMSAVYLGDNAYGQSAAPAITENIQSATTVIIGQSPTGPQTAGTTILFGASLSPTSATGNLQFFDNSTNPPTLLGTATVSNGGGMISVSTLSPGTHQIVAKYSGDSLNSPATSSVLTQVITSATSVTLTSSGSPSTAGQAVILTASITPATATGSVQFLDAGTVIATAALSGGTASTSVNLSAGTHSLTANYLGDGTYQPASSAVFSQVVNKVTPNITLTSSPNPSDPNQSVTFTATVSPSAATGNIQFLDGATVLATVSVSGGSATYATYALATGNHTITAVYSGDANDNGATSTAVSQTVRTATTTTATSNINPSVVGATVLVIAYVSGAGATGTVQFLDGSTALGSGSLSYGSASVSVSGFTNGTHNITAVYSGDSNFTGGTSAVYVQTVKLATNMNITVDNASPAYGQSVKLQAYVNPTAATGTVTFQDGSTPIGTVTLASGVGTLNLSTLAVGSHQITALYSGDSDYGNCGSVQMLTVTVSKATSTAAVSSSLNPAVAGQSVTFTATVSPSVATGTVQFLDGSTALGSATLSGGTAAYSTASLPAGLHTINITYSGDGNYNTASASLTQTVQATTSTSLSASSTTPVFGQAVQLTASIAPNTATGSVQFLDSAAVLGTAALSGGTASLSVSTLGVGAHNLTAVYGGDANDAGSTSAAVVVTVAKANASASGTSSLNPSVSGQSVTFTATVVPSAASGTVQFLDGATSLGTATLSGGTASLTTSGLAAGSHTITASYSGDANYNTASATVAQTVKATTTTTLSANNTSPVFGQAVQLTASIAPNAATGTVQFFDGSTSLGTASISGGTASLSVSTLAVGAHSLTAVYGGDANDAGSTSAAVIVTVSKITATVTLTSSLNPSVSGQSVTFTATVSPGAATGSVQFKDGSTVLGTVNLSSGSAAYSNSSLAVGSHSITAVYSGDANDNGATSAALNQTVNAAPPGAPTNLTATAVSTSQINLVWTASPTSGVTYNVYSSATAGFTPSASNRIATGVTATSYSNTGLAPATTRYYLATAVNSAGESTASNQASATTQAGAPACQVTYTVTTQWNKGFGTDIAIKNTGGATINGWSLTWTWSGNQQITQAWNSNYSQTGPNATLTNASSNAAIAPGSSVTGIGFNASYSGQNRTPTAFYVNGVLCH